MNPQKVQLKSKRADQIKIGDWVVFMPVLGVALQITNIKTVFDKEAKLDRIGLDTSNLVDDSGWEPWRTFTVVEIE